MLGPATVQALSSLKSTAVDYMNNRITGNGGQHRLAARRKRFVRRKKWLRLYFLIGAGLPFDGGFPCTG
jgi:hypothetical protein